LDVSHPNANSRRALCLAAVASWAALASPLHAAGLVVILIGPPGAGKTTQAGILKKDLGMAVISADELISHNQELIQKFKNPSIQGVDPHQDPALNKLVEDALGAADLSKGVVLDGYPAAKTQADYLAGLREKLGLPKVLVVHLRVPDDEVRKRVKNRKSSDLEQDLKNYHREFDFAREYFPQAEIHDIDGTKPPEAVAREIRKLIEKVNGRSESPYSNRKTEGL